MFSDLFWALYLIDVLSQIPGNIGGGIFFGLVAACIAAVVRHGMMGVKGVLFKAYAIPFLVVWFMSVALAFIPSKQTMYMMLGVRATENFTQTEMGKKLEAYINGQMDEFLNKGKGK